LKGIEARDRPTPWTTETGNEVSATILICCTTDGTGEAHKDKTPCTIRPDEIKGALRNHVAERNFQAHAARRQRNFQIILRKPYGVANNRAPAGAAGVNTKTPPVIFFITSAAVPIIAN